MFVTESINKKDILIFTVSREVTGLSSESNAPDSRGISALCARPSVPAVSRVVSFQPLLSTSPPHPGICFLLVTLTAIFSPIMF